MVIDAIENAVDYLSNTNLIDALRFIAHAKEVNLDEGRYDILDTRMYAKVMSYRLKDRSEAKFEAHREYIDIQSPLIGYEGFEYQDISCMSAATEYNKEKDVVLFHTPEVSRSFYQLFPGSFILFLPSDVHMPQLRYGSDDVDVKKIVVKMHKSLFSL